MEQTNEHQVTKKTNLSIIGIAGLAFCGVLVETSMNVTFPTLMRDFHQSLNAVQWVTTGYLLTVALTVVLAAFLQRRFKLHGLIVASSLAFITGGLLCALAPQLWMLLLGRLIQGISTGLAMPLLFFVIMQQIPFAMQGTYAGLGGMVIGLAPSLGPTYGGLVNQFINWRVIFWIVLPIGIIFGLIGIANIQQIDQPTTIHFQFLQYLLVAIGFICLEMGLNSVGTSGFGSPAFYGNVIVALAALIMFGYLTSHRKHPLVNTNVFADPIYLPCLLLYFMVQFIQIGMTFLLPNCVAKLCSINAAPEFFCRWSDALARGTDLSCPATADWPPVGSIRNQEAADLWRAFYQPGRDLDVCIQQPSLNVVVDDLLRGLHGRFRLFVQQRHDLWTAAPKTAAGW